MVYRDPLSSVASCSGSYFAADSNRNGRNAVDVSDHGQQLADDVRDDQSSSGVNMQRDDGISVRDADDAGHDKRDAVGEQRDGSGDGNACADGERFASTADADSTCSWHAANNYIARDGYGS